MIEFNEDIDVIYDIKKPIEKLYQIIDYRLVNNTVTITMKN